MNNIAFLRKFWKGKKVFLTGHTGFKGTWLTLLLEYLNIPVVGISLPPEKNSLYSLMERKNKITEKYKNRNKK